MASCLAPSSNLSNLICDDRCNFSGAAIIDATLYRGDTDLRRVRPFISKRSRTEAAISTLHAISTNQGCWTQYDTLFGINRTA